MDFGQLRDNRKAWESIAQSFHTTRNRPWPGVESFLRELTPQSRVLDAGCGNGRHAVLAARLGHRVVGLDVSRRLLGYAQRSVAASESGWIEGAIERLPLRDDSVDAALGLAVLHHVRGRPARQATLRELVRVMRPQGRMLLSVWTRQQPRFGPGREPRAPDDGRPVEPGDALVRWTQHGLNVDRYLHLYAWQEWIRDLDSIGAAVERAWPEAIATDDEPDNYFAIVRKR